MEFDATRWSCSAHGIVTKIVDKAVPGMVGTQGVDGYRDTGGSGCPGDEVGGGRGLFNMKLTLSV